MENKKITCTLSDYSNLSNHRGALRMEFTWMDLLVPTSKLLSKLPGMPIQQVKLRHEGVSISSKELHSLGEEMDDLLGHPGNMKLRIWQIRGKLSSFKKDSIAE